MPVDDDGGGGNGGSPRNWYSEARERDQGPIYTPYGNICLAGPRSLFVIPALLCSAEQSGNTILSEGIFVAPLRALTIYTSRKKYKTQFSKVHFSQFIGRLFNIMRYETGREITNHDKYHAGKVFRSMEWIKKKMESKSPLLHFTIRGTR